MQRFFINLYSKTVLAKPVLVILALIVVFSYLGYRTRDFRLDASADTLILENDADLKFFRNVIKQYGSNSFLLLTYKPNEDLFSSHVLNKIAALRHDLKKINRIKSVNTILDVPLLRNPPVPIKELVGNIKTLEDPNVDLELAQKELRKSLIYQELIISPTMKTTALQIVFDKDDAFSNIKIASSSLISKIFPLFITSSLKCCIAVNNPEIKS